MRILIVGATGALGSALYRQFTPDSRFDTWSTMRYHEAKRHFTFGDPERLLAGVDVNDEDSLVAAIAKVRPDVVINAVGVVKQHATANDPLVVLPVNAMHPHRLADLCALGRARLIHVSTDCVFSGRHGNYRETDPSDADDLYGKSKFIGEVTEREHVITLRTSGIGHELTTRNSLLEWFLASHGSVLGYTHAIYSGLPWVELARVIRDHVFPRPDLHGLYHVSSDPISKFDLLTLIKKAYAKHIEIEPDCDVRIDGALDSTRFRLATGYNPAPWPDLITLMHSDHETSPSNAC